MMSWVKMEYSTEEVEKGYCLSVTHLSMESIKPSHHAVMPPGRVLGR